MSEEQDIEEISDHEILENDNKQWRNLKFCKYGDPCYQLSNDHLIKFRHLNLEKALIDLEKREQLNENEKIRMSMFLSLIDDNQELEIKEIHEELQTDIDIEQLISFGISKKICKYEENCSRTNINHLTEFRHTILEDALINSAKFDNLSQDNQEKASILKSIIYSFPYSKLDVEKSKLAREPCKHGNKCFQKNEEHLLGYEHHNIEVALNDKIIFQSLSIDDKKRLYIWYKEFKENLCYYPMNCGVHFCSRSKKIQHEHDFCKVKVPIIFPDCKHKIDKTKLCSNDIKIKCPVEVEIQLNCGHTISKICSEDNDSVFCNKLVNEKLPKCEHVVAKPCHKDINSVVCHEKVTKTFTKCQHSIDVECSQDIKNMKCKKIVDFQLPECKHKYKKKCYKDFSSFQCEQKPANRKLNCGHLFQEKCYKFKLDAHCTECENNFNSVWNNSNLNAYEKSNQLKELNLSHRFCIKEIKKEGISYSLFLKIEDKVTKYQQSRHKRISVVKIEEIINKELELRFNSIHQKAFDDYIDEKFHGTSNEAIDNIIQNGFKLPSPSRNNMYGCGIYFASDSSKSAQELYTKGSNKILWCSISLGKTNILKSSNNDWNYNKLRSSGYDSIFAPRNTRLFGGVRYDEYVVFNPDQILPQYIIHFKRES